MIAEGEVSRLGADEAETFDAFYERQHPAAVRLAYVLTGRREVAEELVQDAFLTAYRTWPRVSGYDSLEAWLRRVVVNRCLSSGRRRATEARLLVRLHAEPSRAVALPVGDEQLWQAVRRLPRRQAQCIALRFVDDLSVDDIAVALGCGPETVRTHLRRGLSALARRIDR